MVIFLPQFWNAGLLCYILTYSCAMWRAVSTERYITHLDYPFLLWFQILPLVPETYTHCNLTILMQYLCIGLFIHIEHSTCLEMQLNRAVCGLSHLHTVQRFYNVSHAGFGTHLVYCAQCTVTCRNLPVVDVKM